MGSPGTTFALMSCSVRQKHPHAAKSGTRETRKEKGEIGFSPFSLLPFPSFQPKYGISFVRSRNRTGGTAAAHKGLLFFRQGREDERRYGAVKKNGESAFDIVPPETSRTYATVPSIPCHPILGQNKKGIHSLICGVGFSAVICNK